MAAIVLLPEPDTPITTTTATFSEGIVASMLSAAARPRGQRATPARRLRRHDVRGGSSPDKTRLEISRLSAPSTRNSISRAEASAGNVKVTRGTNGSMPALSTPSTQRWFVRCRKFGNRDRHGRRRRVPSAPDRHWPRRIEPIGAIKCFQIVLVAARCAFGIVGVGRDGMDVLPRRANTVEKHASRRPHIAERIAFRDETVVANEPAHTVPRHSAAPRLFGQQTVEALRARPASQRDAGTILPNTPPMRRRAAVSARAGASSATIISGVGFGVHGGTHTIGRQRRPSRASSSSASLGPSLPAR